MRVDWALPCRYAEAASDGTATIVGAGEGSLRVGDAPADVGVALVLRLAAPVDEFGDEHRLDVRLLGPDSSERHMLSLRVAAVANPRVVHPGLEAGAVIAARFEWEALHLGLYTLELLVDDRRQRSVPFVLRGGSEPDDAF